MHVAVAVPVDLVRLALVTQDPDLEPRPVVVQLACRPCLDRGEEEDLLEEEEEHHVQLNG